MDLATLKKGIAVHGDSGNDPKIAPDWLDRDRFRRGQQFFQCHVAAASFALHCSLTVGFGISNLTQPLAFTKKSDTPPKALSRYMKTYVHVVLWHTQDVWDENTEGHRSTQTIRKMHHAVRRAMDSENSTKSHITQYDMALVQSGFMGAVVMYPSSFGIRCTKEELEDYVFFWRGIGYLLGIKDEFNICSGSHDETYRLCKEIELQIMFRGLLEPPPEFETLANAYINGMNTLHVFQVFTKESIIAFNLRIMGQSLPYLKLSWADRLRVLWFRYMCFLMRWVPGFERLNNFMAMSLYRKILSAKHKELAWEREAVKKQVDPSH